MIGETVDPDSREFSPAEVPVIPLSVVIPSARAFPAELVARVARNAVPGDELLVIENRPLSPHTWMGVSIATERCRDVREDREHQWIGHLELRVLQSAHGAAAARNTGWRAARNGWVLFLDDDVSVEDDFLLAVRTCCETAGAPEVIAFRVSAVSVGEWPAIGATISIDRGIGYRRCGPEAPPRLHEAWEYGTGAAMLASKSLLHKIGGFKPALGAGRKNGGAEDLEFLWHAARHTIVEYRGDLGVGHHDVQDIPGITRKMREYGKAIAALAGTSKQRDGLRMVVEYCVHQISGTSRRRLGPLARVTWWKVRRGVVYTIVETVRVYLLSLLFRPRSDVLCRACRAGIECDGTAPPGDARCSPHRERIRHARH